MFEKREIYNLKVNKGYHKLLIWQKARDLVVMIYALTDSFPISEEFGIKSQLKRAVVSIVLTIVEGYRRNSTKQFLHFLNIAVASLAEVEATLEICLNLNFVNTEKYAEVELKRSEVAFLIDQFIKGLSKRK